MAAKKKAAKKTIKKAAKKAAVKKAPGKGKPFSVTVCELIVADKLSKEQIASKISKEYPGVGFNGMKAVMYYINFITLGKMVKAGFATDSVPDSLRKKTAVKKEAIEKLAATFDAHKKSVKKVAKKATKKTATRKTATKK